MLRAWIQGAPNVRNVFWDQVREEQDLEWRWKVGQMEVFDVRGMAWPQGRDGNKQVLFKLQQTFDEVADFQDSSTDILVILMFC